MADTAQKLITELLAYAPVGVRKVRRVTDSPADRDGLRVNKRVIEDIEMPSEIWNALLAHEGFAKSWERVATERKARADEKAVQKREALEAQMAQVLEAARRGLTEGVSVGLSVGKAQ